MVVDKEENPRVMFPLNGPWELQPGKADVIPTAFGHRVPVPALVDIAQPQYDWKKSDYHWHRKLFSLDTFHSNRHAFLRIDQSQYGTRVYLNDKRVGDSISCYTSQEYRLDDAIRWNGENELIVRVGAKHTLPGESAVGKDMEKEEFIPGIWGDVSLLLTQNARIKRVQVVPHIDQSLAEARVWVENLTDRRVDVEIVTTILENKSGERASGTEKKEVTLQSHTTECVTLRHRIKHLRLWSPDSPFLYRLDAKVFREENCVDKGTATFGMREFTIRGKDFYLNGQRIFLHGSNIAFHRFLSDKERRLLPWDRSWVKRVLIDIPKAHNFNFFRNHLGHMHNAWYDIADEHGMLIQNEWQFWGATGTKEQITKEFTEWLQDNWNHPSIIIWDPLNESSDDVVQKEIVPELRKLDPTRPWESVDFVEEHPYIYSLGPVLNDTKFGFTRSIEEIEKSQLPTVLNEFVWWWLNNKGEPTVLMKDVVERWLGPGYSRDDLLSHQAFLAQELVELFRRMRVNVIQPFVYLSNNEGPTSHWFLGDLRELNPKPILAALKNAFQPLGVSIELWDRHFFAGERRNVRLFVFNDLQVTKDCRIRYGIREDKGRWVWSRAFEPSVEPAGCAVHEIEIEFPQNIGTYVVAADVFPKDSQVPEAVSKKVAHVFPQTDFPESLDIAKIGLLDFTGEIREFLKRKSISVVPFEQATVQELNLLVVHQDSWKGRSYVERMREISDWANLGGSLLFIEPEHGLSGIESFEILQGLRMEIERRNDADRGGYDSFVFAHDSAHPLWSGISPEHLKIFNGAYGGEVVSQHNVSLNVKARVHARCGLGLNVAAVQETEYGQGKILISRLQVRGRLVQEGDSRDLYARRADPVIQKYFLNLLSYSVKKISPSDRVTEPKRIHAGGP